MRHIAFILLPVLTILSLWQTSNGSKNVPPIIFVPGDGGSQLEAKLNKTSTVHYICQKTTPDYFSLWLNIELLVPVVIDCFIDNIKLVYNNETRKTTNQPGVDIRVPNFGDPFSVEWLDPTKLSPGAYFKDIGNALVEMGYERNVSIKGAPFDFRKGPSESLEYFANLKKLVEETYDQNNNTKVILLVHSMGGPMSVLFCQMQTQAWKDKYIRAIVSLSGAFAGAVKALKVFVMGDDLGVFVLNQSVLKEMQITLPSLAWLMPNPLFWKPDEILVHTASKNYSLSNIREFFEDIDYMTAWEMRQDQAPYIKFDAPGVEIHCLHGYGVHTLEKLMYKEGKFPESPSFKYGDGDGTVNKRSLESCTYWAGRQKQKVFHRKFLSVDHMQILREGQVLEYILGLVKKIQSES
ncbi:group XV phospholipase A2 [Cimex lectularius]|uniref:Group XV phospholipase A2 n=1 Tax=Cimex lectularius TaxID=79782 RepID=A0A8I6SEY0_CIMLE|nr:group XV phospholipase A2 [Cimex lectularius]